MPKILLLFVVFFLSLNAYCQPAATEKWLQKNIIPLTDIRPENRDFSDLQPLKKILADKTIVMLGEEDHVFATTFEAKVRLIQFLHEELGFNVLAFEYDLFNAAMAYTEACNKKDAGILKRNLYPYWGSVKSTELLFPYILRTQQSKSPLRYIGIDCQVVPQYHFPDTLHGYLSSKKSSVLTYNYYNDFLSIIKKAWQNPYAVNNRERLLLFSVMDDIIFELELLTTKNQFDKLILQTLIYSKNYWNNIWIDEPGMYHLMGMPAQPDSIFGFIGDHKSLGPLNRRDKCMAENIKWLKEQYYAGEKIIIWAATEHTMYNRHELTFDGFVMEESFPFGSRFKYAGAYKTMGTYVKEYFGSEVYSLAFTTLGGTVNYDRSGNTQNAYPLSYADHSFEAYFAKLPAKQGWLDFSAGHDLPPALVDPQLLSNILTGSPITKGNLSRCVDGIVYISKMRPLEYLKE